MNFHLDPLLVPDQSSAKYRVRKEAMLHNVDSHKKYAAHCYAGGPGLTEICGMLAVILKVGKSSLGGANWKAGLNFFRCGSFALVLPTVAS